MLRPTENGKSVYLKDHADVEAHVPEEGQDGYNSFTPHFFNASEASGSMKNWLMLRLSFLNDAPVDIENINGKTELVPGSPHRLKVFKIFCILFFSSTYILTSKYY